MAGLIDHGGVTDNDAGIGMEDGRAILRRLRYQRGYHDEACREKPEIERTH
jgi:hypothetical protein